MSKMELLKSVQVKQLISHALAEDLIWGDITSDSLTPASQQSKASIIVKSQGVIAGIEIAKQIFLNVDRSLKIDIIIKDGDEVKPGDIIARIKGKTSSILKAERVALNFLQHLSGIASETARYVESVKGLPVQIKDTRKTIPGLRILEKYAVQMGGGTNHRMHLGDGILIKDNHLAALNKKGLSIKEIISRARHNAPPKTRIEIEVKTIKEVSEAVEAGVDIIMLDNMRLEDMRRAVELIKGRALIEASGGINIENVRAVAKTGVDFISIGALTHSSKALDMSLELD